MALYSYIVCEKHYQESNSPIFPLQKGLQNNLGVYFSLETAYKQLKGYANSLRIEEEPLMIRSLEELSQEFYENKYVTNFILLVAQENQVSFVPSEPSIKIYDKVDYYIQVVVPNQVIYQQLFPSYFLVEEEVLHLYNISSRGALFIGLFKSYETLS